MGKKQTLKYSNLWHYKDDPKLNLEICLSELIDNSISSFQKNIKNINTDQLTVNLETIKNTDGTYNVVVTDNAYGMSKEELENCIQLYKDNKLKGSNSMNQYGIGLKHSIFWIGDNANIYTKHKGKAFHLFFEPINKDNRTESTEFESDIKKIEFSSIPEIRTSGTKIVIECLPNKWTKYWTKNSKEQNERIKDFLGKKYSKYISGKSDVKLNLNFQYKDWEKSSNDFSEKIKEQKFNPSPLRIKNLIRNFDINNLGIIQRIREVYDEFCEEKNINKTETMNFLFEKLINNEKIEWIDNITLINKNKKINIKSSVSFLEEPSSKTSGLIICHNKRYIYFPLPKDKKSISTYPYCEERWMNGHHKWIQIEINLEDIEGNELCEFIKPDAKKTSLLFEDDEESVYCRDTFEKGFKNYLTEINKFIEFIIHLSTKSEFKKTNVSDNVITAGYKSKDSITSQMTTESTNENNEKISIIHDNYTINVKYKNDIESDDIFTYSNINEEEKTMDVTINIESKGANGKDKTSLPLLLLYLDLLIQNKGYISEEGEIKNVLNKIKKWEING